MIMVVIKNYVFSQNVFYVKGLLVFTTQNIKQIYHRESTVIEM